MFFSSALTSNRNSRTVRSTLILLLPFLVSLILVFSGIRSKATVIDHSRVDRGRTGHYSKKFQFPETFAPSGIDVNETVKTMTEIVGHFQSDISKKGAQFAWDFDWTQPGLGAGSRFDTDTSGPTFRILLWGGFVRAEKMTRPVLEFTLCHELGHFLGGSPRQVFSESWSSAEGQADWWAASVCLPRVYRARGFNSADQRERIRQAGIDFARFVEFYYETNNGTDPREEASALERTALEQPPATLTLSYPTTQCRLDTIRLGADCASGDGSCHRPRCWFVD